MAFKIVDRTYYDGDERKQEAFGVLEGFTSNTVGEKYLRLCCRTEVDQERYDWFMRVYKEVPHDIAVFDTATGRYKLRDRQVGDVTTESIRLDRRQVIRLIWELIKWLIRGDK